MKKIFLSILFLIVSTPSWAGVSNFTFANGLFTDNVIDSAHATSNFSSNSTYTVQSANSGYNMHINTTSIAGQTATYAHLYIYMSRGFQHTDTIYRVLQPVNITQENWNVYSTGNNWNSAGGQTSGTDYSTSNSASYVSPNGGYQEVDVTGMVNSCLLAGNTCDLLMRWGSGGGFVDTLSMAHNSTNPPYITIATGTPGVPNLWYVRDGGGALGNSSSTCNGTAPTLLNGSNGPNCAVNNPNIITGNGNTQQWNGGDIMYVNGDSDTSFAFVVPSGVTHKPAQGDTYTQSGHVYTVTVTFPTGLTGGTISMSGSTAPTSTGTLINATCAGTFGTCDSSLTYTSEGPAQAIYTGGSTITIPEGLVGQQTKIIGTGNHYPQLFSNGAFIFLDATSSYIDLENLDVTNHDNCITGGPIGTYPNPDGYAYVCGSGATSHPTYVGIYIGGTGLTVTNVLSHGFFQGMGNGYPSQPQGNVVGNITLTNVKLFGNPGQGGVLGNGGTPDVQVTGTVSLINSQVDFNGCAERYPLQDSADIFNNISSVGFSHSIDNESNYYNCWGQNQGGYGDGWGFGATTSSPSGNWLVVGSSISFNTSDGIDTLHGTPTGTMTVIRSRMEGNAGQQVKTGGLINDIENNFINGDCARWVGAPESSTTYGNGNQQGGCPGGNCGFNIYPGDHGYSACRANGDTIMLPVGANSQSYVYGNTIFTNGIAIDSQGSGCNANSAYHIKNNIVIGGASALDDGTISVVGGGATGNERLSTYTYYIGNDGSGGGTCGPSGNGSGGLLNYDEDYNIVFGTKGNNAGCNGAHDICGQNPLFQTTIPLGTISGAASTYYHGTAMMSLQTLTSSSPGIQKGSITGLTYTNGTNDFNNFTPLNLPIVDIGALQYGSSPQSCSGIGLSCTANGNCCSGFCVSGSCATYNCGDGIITSPEVCDGSNLNSQTCVLQGFASGSISCNANCLSFVTSSCSGTKNANGAACSTGTDCISGLCSASICVANICGNGIIEGSELCDGALLNNQTCSSLGFTAGGPLACAGNCLSYNTSSCANQVPNVKMGFGGSIGGI